MPRIFGLIPTTDDLPYWEGIYQGGGGTVAPYGTGIYSIGTVTMPWDGELYASFTAVYSWNGSHQHVVATLDQSTPAVASASALLHIAVSGGGILRNQLPMYGYWTNLVKGQVVTMKTRFYVGGGAASVALEIVYGSARAVRLGA